MIAGVFAFFLLAMAGIPLTSGFTSKWAVFSSAVQGGAWPLVVIAPSATGQSAGFPDPRCSHRVFSCSRPPSPVWKVTLNCSFSAERGIVFRRAMSSL